jgi:3',5'-nucleoside bisphosphate phosphatase
MWSARSGGLDVVALTDHDTCAGIDEALASMPDHLHLIPGIELSTTLAGADIHILGYFIDHTYEPLAAHARSAREQRAERALRIIEMLKAYNIHLTYDDIASDASDKGGVIGRPHIARAMQRKGYVQTIGEAFDRFLGDAGPCFLPTELLHPRAAIDLINAAGGVSMWAHPRPDVFGRILPQLMEWGIRGLECMRPRLQPSEIQMLEETARHHNLLISGGSDWHGSWHGRLGDFFIKSEDVEALLQFGGM